MRLWHSKIDKLLQPMGYSALPARETEKTPCWPVEIGFTDSGPEYQRKNLVFLKTEILSQTFTRLAC